MGYRLIVVHGYSALDHLGSELISLATGGDSARVFASRAQARQALARAVSSLRRTMGPRVWPKIDIVSAGVR